MPTDVVPAVRAPNPRWLLAELTYACPLQCPYCSNPLDFAKVGRKAELGTAEWKRVFDEARRLGAVQLGFSGGEPLLRPDLEELVAHARSLGYYTNLITSGYGLKESRIEALKAAGLDHIQLSVQAADSASNDFIAGTDTFAEKMEVARIIKAAGYPMVMCVVLHRHNIDSIGAIIEMAVACGADDLELANTQYYGWALKNRDWLLPTREQLVRAEAMAQDYRERLKGRLKTFFVVPDYYADRPKGCMNGWGTTFLLVSPDGVSLPCHAARVLPGLTFPNVRDHGIEEIWHRSEAFNRFRGEGWMKAPCKTCPERTRDFGGCRCQAFLLTGDAANADPVCALSPHRDRVVAAIEAAHATAAPSPPTNPIFRNPRTSRLLSSGVR